MPGMRLVGAACLGTIGRPGTRTLVLVGVGRPGRPRPGPAPAGRIGRTGMDGRMPLRGRRGGCGDPGTAVGRVGLLGVIGGRGGAGRAGTEGRVACGSICFPSVRRPGLVLVWGTGGRGGLAWGTGGRGGGLETFGRETDGPDAGFAATGGESLGGAAAVLKPDGRGTAGGAAAPEPTLGPAGCTPRTGIDGAGPRTGMGVVLGLPGSRLMSGRRASGLIAVTGGGSGLLWPADARSDTRVAWAGLWRATGGTTAGGMTGCGGLTGTVEGPTGAACAAAPAGGFFAMTGGRNVPIGGRNLLPAPVTGMDGRTDAEASRFLRNPGRRGRTLDLFLKGSSSSGKTGGGSLRFRSRIFSRTLSAVEASTELEWDFGPVIESSRSTERISLDLTSSSFASSLIRIVPLL